MVEYGVSTQAEGWYTVTIQGKEARRGCSVGSTGSVGSGERRLKLVFCCSCSVRSKPKGFGLLGEQRTKQ